MLGMAVVDTDFSFSHKSSEVFVALVSRSALEYLPHQYIILPSRLSVSLSIFLPVWFKQHCNKEERAV